MRAWLSRPGLRSRVAAGALTIMAVLPLLLQLPRVSVVACFDAGHPLYEWIPNTPATLLHCVSAPTPAVSWTLMIAATLAVQLVLLPLLLTTGGLLVRAARRTVAAADRVLAAALVQLSALFVPEQRLVPVRVRAQYRGVDVSPAHRRRGPPSCQS